MIPVNRFVKFFRWMHPGLKVKRWISTGIVGLLLILASSPNLYVKISLFWYSVNLLAFLVGAGALITGTSLFIKSIIEVLYPHNSRDKGLIDIIFEQRLLAKGPKVVAIGGGTGLSTILEGLKEHTSNITAIVAMADEGGSSGRLREEFGILPPGDVRNCLVSLSQSPKLMRDLFQYRFEEGSGIKGHSFGNLFIAALTEVTGSFKAAVEESSKVLAITGRVIPSSLDNMRLKAEYTDGTVKEGEDEIPNEEKSIKKITLLPADAKPNPEAFEAVKNADIIIFGPGSLFTSIIPNLLMKDMCTAIAKRTDILKLYICNVMTQPGETDGFTAADHVQMLLNHLVVEDNVVNSCLVNSGRLDYKLLFKYAQEGSFPVIFDRERLVKMGMRIFEADVVSKSNYLRHDPQKTSREIMNAFNISKKLWKK
jgi:uncharacterized cofD-like protein